MHLFLWLILISSWEKKHNHEDSSFQWVLLLSWRLIWEIPPTCTWFQKLRAVLGTVPPTHCGWLKHLIQGYVLTEFATIPLPILNKRHNWSSLMPLLHCYSSILVPDMIYNIILKLYILFQFGSLRFSLTHESFSKRKKKWKLKLSMVLKVPSSWI